MNIKYVCEFRIFDGSSFCLYAEDERALTECIMFALDDARIVSWKFIKIDEVDEDERF